MYYFHNLLQCCQSVQSHFTHYKVTENSIKLHYISLSNELEKHISMNIFLQK